MLKSMFFPVLQASLIVMLIFSHLRMVKFEQTPELQNPTIADALTSIVFVFFIAWIATQSPLIALLGLLSVALLMAFIWLDAGLYHLFGFEFGLEAAASVVLSNFYREAAAMQITAQFVRRHRPFFAMPLCWFAVGIAFLSPPTSLIYVSVMLFFLFFFVWTHFARGLPARCVATLAMFAILLGFMEFHAYLDMFIGERVYALSAVAATIGLLFPAVPFFRDDLSGVLLEFLIPRRIYIASDFQPNREDRIFLRRPTAPKPSSQHGILKGCSVVMLSFESLSSYHLDSLHKGNAKTPFLDQLLGSSARNFYHLCPSPLTNRAHAAWYYSQDKAATDGSSLNALNSAGYRTIYITPAITEHYGLKDLLLSAGFSEVVDGAVLTPHALDHGVVSDYALLAYDFASLQRSPSPFFLQIHSANLHAPYRLIDGCRFNRFDSDEDRGRFLNAVEETDWIFSELWEKISALSTEPPLLVVTSDHGQAFGEQGYFTHATGLVKEVIYTPLIFFHPFLAPQILKGTTHFDLFPTILDLLGQNFASFGYGNSIFTANRVDAHFLWDGKPSRNACNCLGLLLGQNKITIDLARRKYLASDWQDQNIRPLEPQERKYFESLIETVARHRAVSTVSERSIIQKGIL